MLSREPYSDQVAQLLKEWQVPASRLRHQVEEISEGDYFVPLNIKQEKGYSKIPSALLRGAVDFVVETNAEELRGLAKGGLQKGLVLPEGLSLRRFYFSAATDYRRTTDTHCVAITGSNGKTTVKELLSECLRKFCEASESEGSRSGVLTTLENHNTKPDIAQKVLQLREQKYAVFEMGARRLGDLEWPVHMVQPEVAVCLNAGSAHLGEFGSRENLKKTKYSIFDNSHGRLKFCVANGEDLEMIAAARNSGLPVILFGRGKKDDIQCLSVKPGEVSRYDFLIDQEKVSFEAPGFQENFDENLAAVLGVLKALNVDPRFLREALRTHRPPKGRFQREFFSGVKEASAVTLVDDSFNASPESMRSGLLSLKRTSGKSDLFLFLGDILELGHESRNEHHQLGIWCADNFSDAHFFLFGEEVLHLERGLKQKARDMKVQHFQQISDFRVVDWLNKLSKTKAPVIYLKSSKAVGLSRLASEMRKGLSEVT